MPQPAFHLGKLAVPAPGDGLLARPRLSGSPAPVTLLSAGPGSGKTTLLGELAAGKAVAWYSVDAYDVDAAAVFGYLAAAVATGVPGFGGRLELALAAGKQDARELWGLFFTELAAYGLPELLVVLDDAHHLPPDVLATLAYFFDKLPAGVRLAIGTRRKPDLALARAQAAGAVRLLGPDELAFDAAEQAAFLRARAPGGVVPPGWRTRAETLGGWPLGLHLATQGLAEGRPGIPADPDGVMAYIAEELYLARPAAERAFMLRAALLEELTAEACRQACAAPDAAERLAALERDHVVQRLGMGERYRFGAAMRAFLLAEAARVHPELERLGWHAAAAAYFLERQRAEAAMPHFIGARDWAGAIAAGKLAIPQMLAAGRHGQALAWIDLFPARLGPGEAWLRLWRGQGLEHAGRHEEAVLMYERARAGFQEAADAAGDLTATVRLASQAVRQHAMQQFTRLVLHAEPLLAAGHEADRADLLLARARAAATRGDVELARECLAGVLASAPPDPVLASRQVAARLELAELALVRGEVEEGLVLAQQAAEQAACHGLAPAALEAAAVRARAALLAGRPDEAGATLRALPAGWEQALDGRAAARAHLALGSQRLAEGDFEGAAEALALAHAGFTRAGDPEACTATRERQAWLALQRGDLEAAIAEAPAREGEPAGPAELGLALVRARAQHRAGRPQEALETLAAALPLLQAQRLPALAARARLYQADAALALGRLPEARASLAAAEAAIGAGPYAYLRAQDAELWASLANLAATPKAGPGPLQCKALGALEVRLDGVLLDQWPRRKAKLVLAALLIYPRGLAQEPLAEILSRGEASDAALSTVHVNVSALRRVLEPALGKGEESRYVKLVGDRYVLDPAMLGALDLTAYEAGMAEGDGLKARDPDAAAAAYERALALYRGNLLDEKYFESYFDEERENLRQRAVKALTWLASRYNRQGHGEDVERVLRRLLELAPCEEDGYLELMAHYQGQGQNERARQCYWDARKALKLQLGVTPGEELEAAYRALPA